MQKSAMVFDSKPSMASVAAVPPLALPFCYPYRNGRHYVFLIAAS